MTAPIILSGRPAPTRGMEVGGVEGVAICDGARRAGDELGVDADSYLNPLRTEAQLEELDRARRYRQIADSVVTRPPKPRRRRAGSETAGFGSVLTGPGSRASNAAAASVRGPHWS